MYKIIKDVIDRGNFDLTGIFKKIDTFWVGNKLSDNQRTELYELAQNKAKPENSVDLLSKVIELEKKIYDIEAKLEKDNTNTDEVPEDGEGDTVVEAVFPEFVVGKWYYAGDTITFEGTKYICIAPEGTVCVWSPKDYPAYWETVVDEINSDEELTEE